MPIVRPKQDENAGTPATRSEGNLIQAPQGASIKRDRPEAERKASLQPIRVGRLRDVDQPMESDMEKYACEATGYLRVGKCSDCQCLEIKDLRTRESHSVDPVKKVMPACLRNLPAQKSRAASSKRRKEARDLAELTVLEGIQRLKAERRSKPKDWERGYNSAITTLELFLQEIQAKRWAGTESK